MTTYKVGARVGHRAAGWPFARFTVTRDELRLTCWPVAWFRPIIATRESVVGVTVSFKLRAAVLRVAGADDVFAGSVIELPSRADQIVEELRRCGYNVVDER